jgi:hypothetical protein
MKVELLSPVQESDKLRTGFVTVPQRIYAPPPEPDSGLAAVSEATGDLRNETTDVDAVVVATGSSESEEPGRSPIDENFVRRVRAKSERPREQAPSQEDHGAEAIEQLQARDREVRAHEQAHASALGPYKSGAPQYFYAIGPDGQRYAVGGEVSVDLSSEPDPRDTIRKMRIVKRAALAPTRPSSTDRAIAARATALEAQAKLQMAKSEREARRVESGETGDDTSKIRSVLDPKYQGNVSPVGKSLSVSA